MLIDRWFPCQGGCGAKRPNSELGTDCPHCAAIKKEKEEFDAKYPAIYEKAPLDPNSELAKLGLPGKGIYRCLVKDGEETYLREKGWKRIRAEGGKDLGWWHPDLSGMKGKYYQKHEAVKIQKKHDRSTDRCYRCCSSA